MCGKNKADEGYATCLVCRMERRGKESHSEESKARHTEYLKRRRDICYAFGVCVACGKRDAAHESSICRKCREKAKARSENKRREMNILPRVIMLDDYHCSACGKDIEPGERKVCDKCYERMKAAMLYARSLKKTENYFERMNKAHWKNRKTCPHLPMSTVL